MNRAQALDEIFAIAYNAWTAAGQSTDRIKWENVAQKAIPPTEQLPWARVTLRHTESNQTSLAGADGKRCFTRRGFLQINIFEPIGQGLSNLPEIIKNAYEGITTPGGVIFNNVTLREIGNDGSFYQTNIIASFEYDEIK